MTLLPIVVREMRVASRRGSTYFFRTGAAALIMVLCLWTMGMARFQAPSETALVLFSMTTSVGGLFALLAGHRFTSDCLSREKRDGTLGLLFLTDLRAYDIVLGKLVAASLDAFYGILAIVPIMALPLLLGGISVYEFARMTLVIINVLFFSLAAGILASSVLRSAQASNGLTLLIIGLLTVGFPALGLWIYHDNMGSFNQWFLMLSPGYGYANAFETAYGRNASRFWISLSVIHGFGWLFLAAACLITPRSWQDRPRSSGAGGSRPFTWDRLMSGPASKARAYREALLHVNPYLWLASRARRQRLLLWLVLAAMALAWMAAWATWKRDWTQASTFFITGGILNLMMRSWFASDACRQMAQDRYTGAFELLLSTPLEPAEMIRGQVLALRRTFAGPLVAVLIIEIVFLIATAQETYTGDRGRLIAIWIGMMGMLILDIYTLPWPCMWFALTCRQPNHAPGRALSWVLVFPWLVFAGFMMLTIRDGVTFEVAFAIWIVFGVATDFLLASWARLRLSTEFRDAAGQRFSPKKSLLDKALGR